MSSVNNSFNKRTQHTHNRYNVVFKFLSLQDTSIRIKYGLVTFDAKVVTVLEDENNRYYKIVLPDGVMVHPEHFPLLARDCVRYYLKMTGSGG